MDERRFAFLGGILGRSGSRRLVFDGVRGLGVGGMLAMLGWRPARANAPQPSTDAERVRAQFETFDDAVIISGSTWALELGAKGAGSDVRSWVSGQVGQVGGPLFINNLRGAGTDTVINPQDGNVGIGTTSPAAKLHVAGDLRVDGSLIGPLSFVSPHPRYENLEIAYASPIAGEAGTYIRGTGVLQDGEAAIALPEHFALLTEPAGLTVQLTARERPLQLYVSELTADRLVVRAAGAQSGSFDFLVQGVRRGAGAYQVMRAAESTVPERGT